MGKHFCFFSALYVPHMGGVERYTYNLARELIQMGHRVTVVTSNTEHTEGYTRSAEGIEVYALPCFPLMNGRLPMPKRNSVYRNLFQKMAEQEYDAVIINTRFYFHSLIGARFAAKRGIPSIVIEHGSAHLQMGAKPLDMLCALYEHGITAVLKRYCKAFYGVSEAACRWLGHFGISAKGILYNAVPEAEIAALLSEKGTSFREIYHIPQNAPVFSFIGRLVTEKGAKSAVDGFLRACEKTDVKPYLFVAGDGPLQQEFADLQVHSIIYLGRLSFQDVIALQKETDFFCFPSSYPEGFCTSVLEAIVCDSVVVATNVPGVSPIISDGESGILLKENSAEAVEEGILRALQIADRSKFCARAKMSYRACGCTFGETAARIERIFTENRGNL